MLHAFAQSGGRKTSNELAAATEHLPSPLPVGKVGYVMASLDRWAHTFGIPLPFRAEKDESSGQVVAWVWEAVQP